jgi:hypothetical protein
MEILLTVLFCGWLLTSTTTKSNLSAQGQINVDSVNKVSRVQVIDTNKTKVIK